MLKKNHDIAACRPVFAEIGIARTRAAQTVTEKHHRRGGFSGRKIDAEGNLALAIGIIDRALK